MLLKINDIWLLLIGWLSRFSSLVRFVCCLGVVCVVLWNDFWLGLKLLCLLRNSGFCVVDRLRLVFVFFVCNIVWYELSGFMCDMCEFIELIVIVS